MGPPPAENLREMTPTTDFKTGPERTTAPYDLSARCVSRRANVVLPITVSRRDRSTVSAWLFGCSDPKGGRDAGRDFYGAVGSKSTVGRRGPSVECVPVHTVQSEAPIHLQGN